MFAVQCVRSKIEAGFIGWRAGDAVAVAEPVQKVAVAAALAAERGVRFAGWLAAKRAAAAAALAS